MLELRKWIIFMVLPPLRTQWQEANMHRGPWEQAGGSRPAQHSPARTHTLAHARSRTPGCDSAPGQQQRPAPAATHAGQRERGRRVPLSPAFPSSPFAPSPPLRSLRLAGSYPRLRRPRALWRLPPPGLAFGGCPSPWPSAGTLQLSLPRARSSGRISWRHGWYSCPGRPDRARLRPAPAAHRCVRPGPAAASCSGRDRLGSRQRSSLPWLPQAPDSARLCSAPGRWLPERDPDLQPRGGFRRRRGLLDQGRPPNLQERHEALAQLPPRVQLIVTISGTHGDVFKPLFSFI